jgi:hypothetical protein
MVGNRFWREQPRSCVPPAIRHLHSPTRGLMPRGESDEYDAKPSQIRHDR